MTELHGSDVVRARLDFSYDGRDFNGWAIQPRLRTVQGEMEAGLVRIVRGPGGHRYDEHTLRITVAGRTDGGVHARGQVAHVDIPAEAWPRLPGKTSRTPADALRERLGGVVGADIVMRAVTVAPEGFDARFSALERRYQYRICDRMTCGTRCPRLRDVGRPRPGRGRPQSRHRRRSWVCATSRLFVADARARRRSASCASFRGDESSRAPMRDWWWRRCGPTRSATRWCGPWWARSWRSGAVAAIWTGCTWWPRIPSARPRSRWRRRAG